MIESFNNTYREDCVLINSVQEFIKIKAWLLLTYFMFAQSINFYTFNCHMLEYSTVRAQ